MYWLWKINNNDYEWGVINKIIITLYFLMDFPTGMESQSDNLNPIDRLSRYNFLSCQRLRRIQRVIFKGNLKGNFLRVVQTKSILLLKSMSERGGSDIEGLNKVMFNQFWYDHHSISESLYFGSVWTALNM